MGDGQSREPVRCPQVTPSRLVPVPRLEISRSGAVTTLTPSILALGLALATLLRASPGAARQSTAATIGQAQMPAEQQVEQRPKGVLAVITQSHSTNSLGYRLVIHHDGSALAEIGKADVEGGAGRSRSQRFPPGTVDTVALQRFLDEIGDVSKIPTGFCPKSVSFGTRTEITYARKTSGDLQCVRPQPSEVHQAPLQASEELGKFVRTTLSRLKINDRRFGPRSERSRLRVVCSPESRIACFREPFS
jgi:hypothetical protein